MACADSSSPLKPSSSRTTDKDDRSSSPALPSDNDNAAASRLNGANSQQQQQQQQQQQHQQLVASTEGCYIYVGEVDNEQQSPVAKIVVKASSDNNDCGSKDATQESTNRLTVAKSTLRLSLTSLESMSSGFRRRSQKTRQDKTTTQQDQKIRNHRTTAGGRKTSQGGRRTYGSEKMCEDQKTRQGKTSSRQGSKKSKPKKNTAASRKGIGLMLRAGKVAGAASAAQSKSENRARKALRTITVMQ